MKLLLDENLPKRLKQALGQFEVYTVSDMGWNGKKNGELLLLLVQNQFNAFITFDKNLRYQQNFAKYSLPVVVLNARDNTFITLSLLVPELLVRLNAGLPAGITEIKGQ